MAMMLPIGKHGCDHTGRSSAGAPEDRTHEAQHPGHREHRGQPDQSGGPV